MDERRGCGSVLLTGLLLVLIAPILLLFWPISLPTIFCWWIERRRPGLGLFLVGIGVLTVGLPIAWTVSGWGFVRSLTVPVVIVLTRAFDGLAHDLVALALPWVSLPARVTAAAAILGLLTGGCVGGAVALARGRRTWTAGMLALAPLLALPVLRIGPEMGVFRPSLAPWLSLEPAPPRLAPPRAPELQMVTITPSKKAKRGPFRISTTRITCAQWASVYPAEACPAPDLPKTSVTWVQAIEFCNRLSELTDRRRSYVADGDDFVRETGSDGYRLLTDAEWLLVARMAPPPPELADLTADGFEWLWDSASPPPGKSSALHLLRGGGVEPTAEPHVLTGTASRTRVGLRVALDGGADP